MLDSSLVGMTTRKNIDLPSGLTKLETPLGNHGMMEQNGNSGNSLMNELEQLLREQHNIEDNSERERDLNIYRSGSAPPTVQGSLDAIGSLCRKPEFCSVHDGGGSTNGIMSEEEMRSHPAYLAYYYSHDKINPRLPPPLLSKEEWRMQQRIRGNGLTLGAIGDLRKKGLMDTEDNSSLFAVQPAHYVPKGENGVIDPSLLHTRNLSQKASNKRHDKSDGLVGLRSSALGLRRRSFADILQADGVDSAASLSGTLSRPASQTAFGDLANAHDISNLYSAGLNNRLETEKSGVVRVNRHSSMISHPTPTSAGYSLPIHSTLEITRAGRSTISRSSPAGGIFPCKMTQNIISSSCSSSRKEVPDISTSLSSLSLSEHSICVDGELVQSQIQQGFDGQTSLISNIPNGVQHHLIDRPIAEKVPFTSIYADLHRKDGIMKNHNVAKESSDGQVSFPKRTNSSANLNSQYHSFIDGRSDGIQNRFHNAIFAAPGCTPDKYSVNQKFNSAASSHLDADSTCNGGSDNSMQPNSRLLGIGSSHLQRNSSHATCTPASQNHALRGNYVGPLRGELVGLQKAHLEALLAQHKQKFDLSLLSKSGGLINGYYEHLSYDLGTKYQGVSFGNSLHALQPINPMLQNHLHTSMMKSAAGGSVGLWNTDVRDCMDDRLSMTLLEELKNNKTKSFELSDIVGHVMEFSTDQSGSRFIQQKLEAAADEEKMKIFPEIVPHARTLMTDVFGNYVIQKLFEHGTESQRTELASQLTGHVLHLSLQMYGCRVIQKALEMVDLNVKTQMVGELDGSVMKCVRDQNGNHVIQKCIECVPEDQIQFIISAFFGQVIPLSTHPYGCRVIQRVLEHCHDPSTQQIIMNEIMQSVCHLAQDPYGNYVIQHVLCHGKAQERSVIISKLAGQIVKMSQQKFASNVIEKCLAFGSTEERQLIVDEMLGSTDENEALQAMMKDQFGNYVVQKVIETSDDETRELIVSRIKVHLSALKKYTYGKHLVARVEKLLASAERRTAPP